MSSTIRQVLSRLVRLKTLPSDDRMLETNLKRSLSTVELIAVGTGNMIGSGLYVLTGVVARDITGPAIIVSYAIAGIVALLAAVCFIEFCSYIPRTGSAYIFTYVVMGEIWAFLIGWNLILEYVISVAAVGKTLSSFIDELCGNAISNFTTEQIMRGRDLDLGFMEPYPDFVGVILVTLLSLFVIGGVSMSARTMTLFLFINITVICIFTIVGLRHADISNWRDYGGFAPYGVSGIVSAAGTLFYSYVGFDSIALSSEETTNPRKSIPAATVTSLLIAAVSYIITAASLTLLVPYSAINTNSPFPSALAFRGDEWAKWLVAFGAICGMITVILGSLFGLPRIAYAMARDGLFFKRLAVINETTRVPVCATITFVCLCNVVIVLFSLKELISFLSVGVLSAYLFVSCSVILLRYRPPVNTRSSTESELLTLSGENVTSSAGGDNCPDTSDDHCGHTVFETPGTLKQCYRNTPVLRHLANLKPGRCVLVSLLLSITFQVCSLAVIEKGGHLIIQGDWYAILPLLLLQLAAVFSFLLIPLHYKAKTSENYFTMKCVPLTPALSIVFDLVLLMKLETAAWIRFVVWVAIGLIVYFSYGYWHSLERGREETTQEDEHENQQASCASYGTLD